MRIPLFHVDAFAGEAFRGNPAAVCLLDSWLDDEKLLKVAAENNLPATAYMLKKAGVYEIRWFTARREIKLCGHGTLAAAFVALNLLQDARESVEFETRYSGMLRVDKVAELLSMDFPALFPTHCPDPPQQLCHALGLQSLPTEVLEANERYIAVVDEAKTVAELSPDFVRLEKLHPYVVAITAPGENEDFVSRYFAPGYGTPEDAVTGSLHCALIPYWSKRLGKNPLHARQLSARGGELWGALSDDRVILKAKAVLVVEGWLTI